MNDRELLELAANACGYDTSHPWNEERLKFPIPIDSLCITGVSTGWNPLTDDGDALRLAVKLGMDINVYKDEIGAVRHHSHGGNYTRHFVQIHDDPYIATRCAIVRAAAEIGKSMP